MSQKDKLPFFKATFLNKTQKISSLPVVKI